MTSCTDRRHLPQAHRERGQVLALLLMLWAAMLGGVLLVFNSGQVVAAKARLIGAADAAAYSAALWQARALNFQAYMNRGIVANEVAIAQMVSLRSWSTYMNQVVRETAIIGTVAPPLEVPLQALARVWGTVDAGLQRALPLLEATASRWNVEVLSRAEYLADLETPVVAANLAHDVAVANVPELGADTTWRAFALDDARRWRALTGSHGRSGEQRERLREVVMSSRDGFSRSRDWTFGLPLVKLKKRGGTDLLGYESWRGMDTAALHVSTLFSSIELPVAWGVAENRHRSTQLPGDFGGSVRDNPETSAVADDTLVPRNGYAGLPSYRDVHMGRGAAQPQLRFELELRQPAATIATSDVVMNGAATVVPGEEPKVALPGFHSNAAFALAAAQVWFTRPVGRADRRTELANLFNPYWQARLAPVTHTQRAVAAAVRGGPPDPYLVLP